MKYSIQYILFLCCSYAVTSTAAPTPVDHRSLSSLHHARITRDNFVARRQVAEAADALGSIVTSIISGITAGKAQDSDVRACCKLYWYPDNDMSCGQLRGKFTTDLVSSMTSNDPKFNYVVCHTQHTTAFDGKENTDWFHTHQEVDVHIGGTIGSVPFDLWWTGELMTCISNYQIRDLQI